MVARSRSAPPLNLMAEALRFGLSEDLEEERAEPLPDFLVLVPMVFDKGGGGGDDEGVCGGCGGCLGGCCASGLRGGGKEVNVCV